MRVFNILGLILWNVIASLVLLELVLRVVAAVWVEPEKVLTGFAGSHRVVRVLALGDSNTYGLYLDHNQAWPIQFEHIWNESLSPKVSVLNFAYPGTNTVILQREIDKILDKTKPDIVLLMIGGNDFWTASLPGADGMNPISTMRDTLGCVVSELRIYKLFSLVVRQTIYQDVIHDTEADLYQNVYELPESEATVKIRQLLEYKGLTVQCNDAGCLAVNGEKSISLHDIYRRLLSTKNTQLELYDGLTLNDPIYLNLNEMNHILSDTLGADINTPSMTRARLIYRGQEFTLGSIPLKKGEIVGSIADRMAANLGKINRSIIQHGATAILLNYHINFPVNRDIRAASNKYNIPVININSAINRVCNPGHCPSLLFPDGHPREAGQRLIAEQVKQYFVDHPLCEVNGGYSLCR